MPGRSQTFSWLNHNSIAQKILIWCSAMRIPSTFAHYSERGGAADSCEHRFVEVIWGGIFTYQSMPGRSQTFSWLNHDIPAEKILIWCSAMRIPSTFAHYSERGGAADSCEHRFVEVIWGGIFTYQSMPGRSQTFSWLNHNSIAEKILIWSSAMRIQRTFVHYS